MLSSEDDDIYVGFDETDAFDVNAVKDDEKLRDTLRTAGIGRQNNTIRSANTITMSRYPTSMRTAAVTSATRPMTAVRAAGYTSSTTRSTPTFDEKKEETLEDKVRNIEDKIMRLIEESATLYVTSEGRIADLTKALSKAQEASSLERQLIRLQEQASLGDVHNLDLTFSVLCNLAAVYTLNDMYSEALNTYQLLTRNKMFPHANRLKVNMGNIYFKMGEHPKALKLYRMALDQTPTAEKDLRMKVIHNIGLLLVRMGKFRDAVANFQHIMHEQPDIQTGLHVVLCSVALNDLEGGKGAFHSMLDVDMLQQQLTQVEHDVTADDVVDNVIQDILTNDKLSRWIRVKEKQAERCLLTAAAALAPLISPTDDAGLWWCVEALRGWEAGARLELSAALNSLRYNSDYSDILRRLRSVGRANQNQRSVRADANADAAFIAYAIGDYEESRLLSEAASTDDPYNCSSIITNALCEAVTTTDWSTARDKLAAGLHTDPSNMHILYNLGLSEWYITGDGVSRWLRVRESNNSMLSCLAAVSLARAYQQLNDQRTAEHWYGCISNWDCGITTALGQLYEVAGDTTTAAQHYQDAESVWSCDTNILVWMAEWYRAERPDLAAVYYLRAATLEPNNVEWGVRAGACLRTSSRHREALALYKRLYNKFPDNKTCLRAMLNMSKEQGLRDDMMWAQRELNRLSRGASDTTSDDHIKKPKTPSCISNTEVIGNNSTSDEQFEDLPLPFD